MDPVHLLIAVAVSQVVLYAARRPVHALLRAVGIGLSGAFRLVAKGCGARAVRIRRENEATLVAEALRLARERLEHERTLARALVPEQLRHFHRLAREMAHDVEDVREGVAQQQELEHEDVAVVQRAAESARARTAQWERAHQLSQQMSEVADAAAAALEQVAVQEARCRELEQTSGQGLRLRRAGWARFGLGVCLLGIVAGGIALDYALIAGPLQSLLPAAGSLAPLALVVLSLVAGFCAAEGFGLSRLLGAQSGRSLRWAGGAGLLAVAAAQWTLAFSEGRVTTAVLAFMLPLLTGLAAVPAYLVGEHAGCVSADVRASALEVLAQVLRLAGHALRFLFAALRHAFDVYVAVPLWVERRVGRSVAPEPPPKKRVGVNLVDTTPSAELSRTRRSR